MAKLLDLSVYGPGHISNILQVDASVYAKAFVTDGGKDTQVVRGDGTLASISSLSVGNAVTATNAPWSGITGKPTTFTPSAHTHTASDITGLPTSLKNPYKLTFGSKTYDGSAAATITASDLGALTSITKSMVEGVLTGNITSHTHSQYLTSALRPAKLFVRKEMFPPGYFIIKINNNSEWILSFDVKIVVPDGSYTIRFSEDNSTKSEFWDSPSASMIDGEDSIEVKFVYSRTNKLVAIPAPHSLVGISITNVANGYAPIDTYDLDKLFTINFFGGDASDLEYLGTVQETITIYPPSKEGHTHTFASLTSKPTTINGYGITDALTTSNYNSYVPTRTGTGASGTWGISISGNAATASSVDWSGITNKPSSFTPSSHTHDYLPLSGGTMTGTIKYGEASYEIIRTGGDSNTWRGGLKYSWSSNTTIALWGKNANTQFVWHAGTDFSSNDVNGTANRSYDFQVGRVNGTLEALIGGNKIWHAGNLTKVSQLTNDKGYVTSSGVTSVATGTGLTGGTITSTGTISINSTYQTYISHGESAYNSLGNYVLKKPNVRFYNYIGCNVLSKWYKITLPFHNTTSTNNRWMMVSMELILKGNYSNGADGTIYLSYYIYYPANNNVGIANNVYALAIGSNMNNVRIAHNKTDLGIFYVYVPSNYNSFAIQNLSANDSAPSYDFTTTTIDALSSSNYPTDNTIQDINIRKLYTTDGTSLTLNGNILIDAGNIGSQSVNYANSAGSVAWGNVTGKPSTFAPSSHSHSYLPLSGGTLNNNSMHSTLSLNATNGSADAWNKEGNAMLRFVSSNNAMVFSIGSPSNERTGFIQVGHADANNYAYVTSALHLNKLGGAVYINNNIAWHAGNDGSDSGLDADLLDGKHASDFAIYGHNHDTVYVKKAGDTMTGSLTLPANGLIVNSAGGDTAKRVIKAYGSAASHSGVYYLNFGDNPASGNCGEIGFTYVSSGSTSNKIAMGFYGGNYLTYYYNGSSPGTLTVGTTSNYHTVLTSGNTYVSEGHGVINGNTITQVANADTVDSQHFSYSNDSNSPTYLWATNSNGSSFLAARGSISVNYANSAGSAGSAGYTARLYANSTGDLITYPGDYSLAYSRFQAGASNIFPVSNNANGVITAHLHNGNYFAQIGLSSDGRMYYRAMIGYALNAGVGWNKVAWTSDIPTSLPANGGTSSAVTINYNNDSNSTYQMLWGSGNYVYGTSGIYCNPYADTIYASGFYETSDERLKDFENSINVDLNLIRSIPKMYFRWKKNPNKLQIGTSAQAVKQIYPELVSSSEDGILSVDYSKLSIVALSAIDKLHLENQNLKHEINLLKQEIEKLKGQI